MQDNFLKKSYIASIPITSGAVMIRSVNFSLLILLVSMIAGCASTKSAENKSQQGSQTELQNVRPDGVISDDKDYFRDLADYLHRVPGITISGQTVTIRGISSFHAGNEPLFVIDGQVVGSSYADANNMLNVRDIDYVRVLKGADASVYGVRGANGVVLIVTKK